MKRIEYWRHFAEIVAICAAAAWALYVFVYQERIKPANAPVDIQPSISVGHTALQGGREFVKVSVQVTDISEAPLSLDGMVVNVYGIRYGAQIRAISDTSVAGIEERSRALAPTAPSFLYSFLDMWKPFGSSRPAGISPHQTFLETFVFALPAHAFDVAKIDYLICYQRPDGRTWPVTVSRRKDGSTWIDGALDEKNTNAGLRCRYQIRGEYDPL